MGPKLRENGEDILRSAIYKHVINGTFVFVYEDRERPVTELISPPTIHSDEGMTEGQE